jgi:DNA-directed RNA polymerase specialized sigma24 family protein
MAEDPEDVPAGAPFSERTRRWLGDAYTKHCDFVARLMRRDDIEPGAAPELAHDVFLTLGKRVRDHEIQRNAPAMLVTIAGFAIRNYKQRRGHRPPVDDDADVDDAPASGPDGVRWVHVRECERIVAAVLALITPAARELIQLIDLDGRSHAQAAAIVGRRVEAVTKQHERAIHRFEELALRYLGL